MTGPRSVGASPAQYLGANRPQRAWVFLTDNAQIVIDAPQVISDTLFGFVGGQPVSVRVERLKEIRVRRVSLWRTAIIPAVLVGGAVASVVFVKSIERTVDPWDNNSQDDDNSVPVMQPRVGSPLPRP